jgi:PAS domain S-box-containing protein
MEHTPHSNLIFSRFIEQVKDYAIFSMDTEGIVTSWNIGAQRIKGYTEAEVIGKHFRLLFPDAYRLKGLPEQELLQAKQQSVVETEDWRRKKDGSLFLAHITLNAVYDEKNLHIGYTKVTRDLTQSKQLKDELAQNSKALLELNEQLEERSRELAERNALLIKANERYALIAQASTDLIWDWDLITNEVERSQGLLLELGYKLSEIDNKVDWWFSMIHPQDKPGLTESIEKVLRGEQEGWTQEFRFRRKDGSYAYVHDSGYIIKDEEGKPRRIIGTMKDITLRKQAEMALTYQLKLTKTIADNATSCLLMMDKQGYCTFMNPAGEKMFGYTFEEIRQTPLHYMIHHHRPDGSFYPMEECPIDRALPENYDIRAHQDIFFRKDGTSFPVSCAASPIFEGGVPVSTVIEVRDITDEKRFQTQLLHLNAELSGKNQQLEVTNHDLTRVNRVLERTNKDLDNFVYTASHDLKVPILNMEGLIRALERQLSRQPLQDQNVRRMFEMLYASVDRFKHTIRDLTQVAQIGKEEPEDIASTPLYDVMKEVMQDLEPQIQEAGSKIEYKLPCSTVIFSRKNLKSILYNLLSNAIKYRSPDRQPLVHISCEQEGEYQVLSVKDNGLGIDMRQEEKIFGLFKRLHTHVEGTGIGLYIVKQIIENAAGKIEVESRVGEGSTFRVYFRK